MKRWAKDVTFANWDRMANRLVMQNQSLSSKTDLHARYLSVL